MLNFFLNATFLNLQKILEEIVNADSGAPCSPRHLKKKHFVDTVKKGVTSHATSKQLTESAAIACVKLCKISTYVPTTESTNVTFYLVQYVINDIKVFHVKNRFFFSIQIKFLTDFIVRHYSLIRQNRMLVAKVQTAPTLK